MASGLSFRIGSCPRWTASNYAAASASDAEVGAAHFIMLTAHSDKSRLLDAYDAGVDDFVSKPFDHEELLARVRAGIRTAKLHDDLVRKATGSQALNAQLATAQQPAGAAVDHR